MDEDYRVCRALRPDTLLTSRLRAYDERGGAVRGQWGWSGRNPRPGSDGNFESYPRFTGRPMESCPGWLRQGDQELTQVSNIEFRALLSSRRQFSQVSHFHAHRLIHRCNVSHFQRRCLACIMTQTWDERGRVVGVNVLVQRGAGDGDIRRVNEVEMNCSIDVH